MSTKTKQAAKGGVGKSTSATNIAVRLVQVLGHLKAPNSRVLLIDTGNQSHATLVTTGYNDFGKDASHVLPASPTLEGAERELQGTAGAPYHLSEPLSKIAAHYATVVAVIPAWVISTQRHSNDAMLVTISLSTKAGQFTASGIHMSAYTTAAPIILSTCAAIFATASGYTAV